MAEYLDEVDTKSLLTAVQYGDLVKVKDLISQNRISPQSQDSEGCFMLHWVRIPSSIPCVHQIVENMYGIIRRLQSIIDMKYLNY